MSKIAFTQNFAIYDACPIGAIITFPATAIPAGWLECNGQAVDRTTYALLYSLIGTSYGTGDGSTTFNLPDYRGAFLRGKDNGKGYDAGRTLGSYQADDVGPHTHPLSVTQSTASGGVGYNCPYPNQATQAGDVVANTGTETRPKNVSVIYCIKATMVITGGPSTVSTFAALTHITHYGEAVSFAGNGYKKFADGLIIQWGYSGSATDGGTISFPVTFPNVCYSLLTSIAGGGSFVSGSVGTTLSQFTIILRASTTGSAGTAPLYWAAVGR